jgi:hypothetical protein
LLDGVKQTSGSLEFPLPKRTGRRSAGTPKETSNESKKRTFCSIETWLESGFGPPPIVR